MTQSSKLFPALMLLFLFVACATFEYQKGVMEGRRALGAETPSPEISSERGRVWFYRIEPRSTLGLWPRVLLDEKVVGEANPYKLYYIDISPGTYEVSIGAKKVPIVVEKQRHVFIEAKVSSKGIYPEVVDPEVGKQAINFVTCEAAKEETPQCK